MISLKANKFIKSLGVSITGLAMLAASSLPAFAQDLNTIVSGKVTNEYTGREVSGAKVNIQCVHKFYLPYVDKPQYDWISKDTVSNSVGYYSVSFDKLQHCVAGDRVHARASYDWYDPIGGTNTSLVGYASSEVKFYNTYYITFLGATLNITMYTAALR